MVFQLGKALPLRPNANRSRMILEAFNNSVKDEISFSKPLEMAASRKVPRFSRGFFVCGGCSSVGRALDCDSGGRGFEPRQSPQFQQLLQI